MPRLLRRIGLVALALLIVGVNHYLGLSPEPHSESRPKQSSSSSQLAAAAEPSSATRPESGFDHYVLALTWHPAFCRNLGRKECRKPPEFARTELVLHGLWPNDVSYCAVSRHDERASQQRDWCDIEPLSIDDALRQQLQRSMPGVQSCLQRHEWAKHGSCSGLNAQQYYALSDALVQRFADSATSDYLARNRGNTVSRKAFYRAISEDLGREGSWKAQAICRDDRFQELRLYLRRDLDPRSPYADWLYQGDVDARARCSQRFTIDGF